MNGLETWFCGSPFWRYVTRRQLLPWILEGSELGSLSLARGRVQQQRSWGISPRGLQVLIVTTRLRRSSVHASMA